ncbi:CBS domain-containing protein [Calidifontibacter sp. DB0510]|uniref:CBS domain-containing protein n=1 Tax=Metallococcus carri TaxID=1656884 RepID=A0A967EGI2_9MICO|nr:CBS domain-containing protein [Metallococcus carri]NHN55098.1 CBS domain-containing protein [Metallococcus carri]NOP36175.1 CBS domain-containing protein [Calidifontibacter sp. DB2511S]
MRAREMAEPFPVVDLDTDALQAAAAMAKRNLPGIVVRGEDGKPHTVIPGSQVLNFVIPQYVQDDPHLARVYDEEASDAFARKLASVTVRDVLPKKKDLEDLPVVDGDATGIEVAAVMARMHSPIAVVCEGEGGEILGVIRMGKLMSHLLPEHGQEG